MKTLLRFSLNLASGFLTVAGSALLASVLIGCLLGIFHLVGMAAIAVIGPEHFGPTVYDPGSALCVGLFLLCTLVLFVLLACAGWNISKWIRDCWRQARGPSYRYFRTRGSVPTTFRVDRDSGEVSFRSYLAAGAWLPSNVSFPDLVEYMDEVPHHEKP